MCNLLAILWYGVASSRLKSTPTMMVVYIMLSMLMEELLLLQYLLNDILVLAELKKDKAQFSCDLWADNSEALVLSNLDQWGVISQPKHYNANIQWFWSKLICLDRGTLL
mmetsp:Transcript_39061/g.58869  ORF Transcript_39061/g.58869 Transcript_39061/m.58869 type:complete len:110 (-) Transcript_39061:8-337(-)